MVIVELPEPGAAIEDGLKATVVPEGWPEADSATALLKPPETVVVMVTLPEPPWAIEVEAGEAEIVKSLVEVVSWMAAVQISSLPPLRRSVQEGKKRLEMPSMPM